ncbi:hypothetical protein HKD37_17G048538 [Glycine soja]|nr:hypothetical protein GmHk_17G049732 [Glycine max]
MIITNCIFFADDIVLIEQSGEAINNKLKLWRQTLETKDLRLSRSKMEYMHYNFSKRQEDFGWKVNLGEDVIPQASEFKYLGLIIQDDDEINEDDTYRIQVG